MDPTNTNVELLAPAGKWDVLEAVIEAGADAVYLGGKRHNMRMFRSDFNFDDDALTRAVDYAHARGVKIFVTVNSLLRNEELSEVAPYLEFLETIRPDALIVQDLGVIHLVRRLGLSLPLHASVMANALNLETLDELARFGIERVVLGREVSFADVRLLHSRTSMELEYFIHGDMCIAQSGQCLTSGILFGESANRGRCMKPCRWSYRLADGVTGEELPTRADGAHFLAIKDLCLLRHVPELIQSGICCFKIEGRMRPAEYLSRIVAVYRSAIDRYLRDPAGYRVDGADIQQLMDTRVRDFSTCYVFANPGASGVGYTGEREPRFFSLGCQETALDLTGASQACCRGVSDTAGKALPVPSLAVRVGTLESVRSALETKADLIYVGGEDFGAGTSGKAAWDFDTLARSVELGQMQGAKVVVCAPRIAMTREMAELSALFRTFDKLRPDAVLVSSLGQVRLARELTGIPIYGDFGLNVFNGEAMALLKDAGVAQVTISLEASLEQVAELAAHAPLPVEAVIHGALPGMVLEHCLPAALLAGTSREECWSRPCVHRTYDLLDTHGQRRPVRTDQYCRNHVYMAKDLATLPYLNAFVGIGLTAVRIEGQLYDAPALRSIATLYAENLKRAAANPEAYRLSDLHWRLLQTVSPRPLGYGPYARDFRRAGEKTRENDARPAVPAHATPESGLYAR